MTDPHKYKQDKDGFVSFGDVSRRDLGKQCQYGSRYVTSDPEYPNLGKGLRFKNLDSGCYHDIKIHVDDIEEFVRRYKEYQKTRGL